MEKFDKDSLRESNSLIDKQIRRYLDKDLYGGHLEFRGMDQRVVKPSATAGDVLTTVAAANGELYSQWESQDGIISADRLGVPEVLHYYLGSNITGAVTTCEITGSTRTWTQAFLKGGNYVGWDSTNKRPYAKQAGMYRVRFRVRWMLDFDASVLEAVSYPSANATLKVNNTTGLDYEETAFGYLFPTQSTDYWYGSFEVSAIYPAAVNDYFNCVTDITQNGGGAPTTTIQSSRSNTNCTLEYLGRST